MGRGGALRDVLAIAAGRAVRRAVLLLRPGGATAIPGRVMEWLSPGLLARVLARPPHGVVVVTGSNGKSTTTKMVAALLEAHGMRVFTNKFTANITRGMLSELLREVDWRGRIPHEIAVMEVDEGYSALLAERLPPRVTVLLNVMIDQLHRWGEPERVAAYLERAARRTTGCVVVNRDDPQLRRVAALLPAPPSGPRVRWFSVAPGVAALLPHGLGSVGEFSGEAGPPPEGDSRSEVVSVGDGTAALEVEGAGRAEIVLPSRGIHFAADAAAAVEAARAVLGARFRLDRAIEALGALPVVFGRGERTTVGGEPVEFVLAKSPATFQANLDALDPGLEQCFVGVGRDIVEGSPLWMTDWSAAVRCVDVVAGWQCWDMALKLSYDEVEVGRVEEDLEAGARFFLAQPAPGRGVKTLVLSAQALRRLRRSLGLFGADTERPPASDGEAA